MYINLFNDIIVFGLLGIANTSPIVARHIFRDKFSTPIDFNKSFFDKRPILGTHKTWRGIFASIIATTVVGFLLGVRLKVSFLLALFSMCGDLISSFLKRRLGLSNGARCLGVDQTIEALLPLVLLKEEFFLSWLDCFFVTIFFVIFDITMSPLFYRLGLRRNPY